jgi:hypothetical protein
MAGSSFVIVPSLVAVAVAYPQGTCIADYVLPRKPVYTESFRYLKYNSGDSFTTPDTRVGRKSAPNLVDWSSSEQTGSTSDHGLDTAIPNKDQIAWEQARQAGEGYASAVDPQTRYTGLLMQAILNRREARAAALVFNTASYAANNQATLSGTSQWSDYNNSNPALAIMLAFDQMLVRPTHGAIGRLAFSYLRAHPKIVRSIRGGLQDQGFVTAQEIADLLELKALYVGDAFLNTAKPGQPATMTRAWGKHASFFCQDIEADTTAGVTFGLTAQWGDRVAGIISDADVGLRGGVRVRAGESVGEFITANDLGYYFQNVVA